MEASFSEEVFDYVYMLSAVRFHYYFPTGNVVQFSDYYKRYTLHSLISS